MAAVYSREAVTHIPRLLGAIDREPHSVSYGSVDREHWAWKFRDFPVTMLQLAMYPLALAWRHSLPGNTFHGSGALLEWLEAAVENTCRRQRPNGAFDSLGPYTQDHGVTLAMVYALAETANLLKGVLRPALHSRVCDVVKRGCEFALQSREDYAYISNHHGMFALAYLAAHELLDDARLPQRARAEVGRIVREQSADGWYREYEGADPGYESLGISYLATYWARTRAPRVLDSLRRSVEFYAHCVHPDGGVGGVYGSRHTSLYFPDGLEILATEIPMAAAVARFMRERLARRNVVTPSTADPENLPSLIVSYLQAAIRSEVVSDGTPAPALPCQALSGSRHFAHAGITVAGGDRYYAVVSSSKGGVCRVFDRETETIAYEDAGYVIEARGRRWASQFINRGRCLMPGPASELISETQFAEVRQTLPTPVTFMALRLLNLTLFRSLAFGRWIRRRIIARLITDHRSGPLRLRRLMRFAPDAIHFRDELEVASTLRVETVALPRAFTAVHMGSAKYFLGSELQPTPQVSCAGLVADLARHGAAQHEFTLRFPVRRRSELVADDRVLDARTADTEALTR